MLTPFPGTVDFAKWEREAHGRADRRRHAPDALLADSPERRPKVYTPHPTMSAGRDPRSARKRMGSFYALPRSGSARAS